ECCGILPTHPRRRRPFVRAIHGGGSSLPELRTSLVRRRQSARPSCRSHHWKKQRERRAVLRLAGHTNLSAVLLHHPLADRETKARASRSSRKAGLIDSLEQLRRDAAPLVLKVDLREATGKLRCPAQVNRQLPARRHSPKCIQCQIEKHLL